MSTRGTFVEGHHVYLDDAHGWPTHIPSARIPELLAEAKRDDQGRTRFALRWFDRDALQGAFDLLPVCGNCRDALGTEDVGDDIKFCAPCCSSAQGSHLDDRTEV